VSYRVVVTARAMADAIEAFRWIAERSPDAAARWYEAFEQAIATLADMPERCPVAEDESKQLGITLRQLLYGRRGGVYRILFSIEGETVTLHYVRHSARGPIEY
jgi:plasmid stabilization system protein ParE